MSLAETLPASWYSSKKIFDLELRAIFHQSWMYTCHTCRFVQSGDFITFNIAEIDVVILKGNNGAIQAYHNICGFNSYDSANHTTEVRNGAVFHWGSNTPKNWHSSTYDTEACHRMLQEPQYRVNCHITDQGLIYLKLAKEGAGSFEESFYSLEDTTRIFDFSNYHYYKSYELVGDFNWKTLVDGYQECYHCSTTHPGLSKAFALPSYKIVPNGRWCRHYAKSKNENNIGEFDGLWMYMFPNAGVNCYSPAWYTLRILPTSACSTTLQYDIYKKKGSNCQHVEEFVNFMQQLNVEDYRICEAAQRNLDIGVYSTGPLNPRTENGVEFYQSLVKDMTLRHLNEERALGREVQPAQVDEPLATPVDEQADYYGGQVMAY